jgi:hypothetical protein
MMCPPSQINGISFLRLVKLTIVWWISAAVSLLPKLVMIVQYGVVVDK